MASAGEAPACFRPGPPGAAQSTLGMKAQATQTQSPPGRLHGGCASLPLPPSSALLPHAAPTFLDSSPPRVPTSTGHSQRPPVGPSPLHCRKCGLFCWSLECQDEELPGKATGWALGAHSTDSDFNRRHSPRACLKPRGIEAKLTAEMLAPFGTGTVRAQVTATAGVGGGGPGPLWFPPSERPVSSLRRVLTTGQGGGHRPQRTHRVRGGGRAAGEAGAPPAAAPLPASPAPRTAAASPSPGQPGTLRTDS